MTVLEILKDAILFSQKPELLSLSTFKPESQTQPTIDQQSDIDLFVRCFNFVYKEICANYIPLLKKEKVTFLGNKLEFSALTEKVLTVKSLKDENGHAVQFYVYPTYIEADVKNAQIVYSYLPNDFALTDEVNLFSNQVLPQVVAYGVAREFSLINGFYADADVWESRFKNGVFMALSQKRNKRIPARRFR